MCRQARALGCTNHGECRRAAQATFSAISSFWDPTKNPGTPHRNLTLTEEEKEQNLKAISNGGTVTFDPSLLSRDDLKSEF